MKVTFETSKVKETCVIDLEQDFPNRTAVLDYLYKHDIWHSTVFQGELYNADLPSIWIRFTIEGKHSILGISLTL